MNAYTEEIKNWREKGYTVIRNLFDEKVIKKCVSFLEDKFRDSNNTNNDFGSKNGELEFPSGKIIDKITINEKLICIVQTLLNSDNILLVQSDTWSKSGEINNNSQSNKDQRMHMDYGNNTFLHPSTWDKPEAVAAIVYFSDTSNTGGGTAIVPRNGINDELYQFPYINMPGQHIYPFFNNKDYAEKYFKSNHKNVYNFRKKLYEREKILDYCIGDVLFYRLDVWHRGTPVLPNKIRNVMNLLWKKKECYWINTWNPGWTKKMYYGILEKMFEQMSPLQRSLFGVPLPGEKYWTLENILLLKQRYLNIDINPYLSKL